MRGPAAADGAANAVCDVRQIRAEIGLHWVYANPWVRHYIEGQNITRPGAPHPTAQPVPGHF